MSGTVNVASSGTPTSTIKPSSTEVERSMNDTTIQATIDPTKRARTSYAPPIRIASAATVLTTSPDGISSVRAVPVVAM